MLAGVQPYTLCVPSGNEEGARERERERERESESEIERERERSVLNIRHLFVCVGWG